MSYQSKQSTDEIQVIIVLPFLNEQISLINTCYSLGFGLGARATSQNIMLFMIDNGSTDDSVQIAESIKSTSRINSVVIGYESERGYVPPRHKGNLLAREYSESKGWDERNVLILQVDADTIYDKGYVESMQSAAQAEANNILFQAEARYPLDFKSKFLEYIQICNEIDNQLEEFFAEESSDVLIDDKLSGYLLEDYFKWGGHQREFTLQGDEIHSETARLYMKARAHGATKFRVSSGQAFPSMRKTIEEPSLHFAAAGFPRETSWNEKWLREYHGPDTIQDFCKNLSHPEVQKAIDVRRQHIIALFGILPLHVSKALGESHTSMNSELYTDILSRLPKRTMEDLRDTPGIFITDVFNLLDSKGTKLLESLFSNLSKLN